MLLSKSLCSPLGAQSAVGLPYCGELMVSLARYFPLLFQREEGRFVGLVDEERGRKVGEESSVRVPPGLDCVLRHPAGNDPAGNGTRQPWSSVGLPHRATVVDGGSVITLVPQPPHPHPTQPLCLSWPSGPLTPLWFHYCILCAI